MIKNRLFVFIRWLYINNLLVFSPRMWRWSQVVNEYREQVNVFSTYVEVIPAWSTLSLALSSFLHVCGGDPKKVRLFVSDKKFSPRMWRWSQYSNLLNFRFFSFLHVCGGDPIAVVDLKASSQFSPRMWRWSYDARDSTLMINVFSTYVEVILNARLVVRLNLCFLHVCGGDPTREFTSLNRLLFSPRMWRWSYERVH